MPPKKAVPKKSAPKNPAPKKASHGGRGQLTWTAIAHELTRLLAEGAPAWMSDDTRQAVTSTAALLEGDVAAVLGCVAGRPAAEQLGVSHRSLMEWRADGWLAGKWLVDRRAP